MKQSLSLLIPPGMPRYSDSLQDARHYVWIMKEGQTEPADSKRALRAFGDRLEARRWAKKNLDHYFIASRA